MPTAEDGYSPPRKWDGKKIRSPNGRGYGWPDKKGRVWVPTGPGGSAHGGPHWDVQIPGGGYINVYPGGRVRGGR
ncbi:polymorphic toxin type 37 domain-containing protein [Marilutibacter maris]